MVKKTSLVALLVLITASAVFGAYSGAFIVGPAGRFADPYVAGESLRTYGISGPCTLKIQAGSYTLSSYVYLYSVTGASTYPMIWKPQNPGDVVNITYSSYTFYIGYTNNVKLYDLNLTSTGSYVVYLYYYASGCKLEHCTMRGPYGPQIYYYCDDDSLIRNDIKVTSSYGVYDYNGAYSNRHVYIGNMIYGWTSYGIYSYYSYYNKFLYNTIIGTGSYALYQYYSYYDTLRDNILQAASYAWYRYYGSTYPDSSDFNCFWLNGGGTSIIYGNGTAYTLATWRTASARDAKSISYNPQTGFPANPRLKAISPCIDSGNRPYAQPPPCYACTVDVDGTNRNYGSTQKPDIGAYEWAGATAMSGIYHVKPGVTMADTFPTISASLSAVVLRGCVGNVTFHVLAGTYAEGQIDFTAIGNGAYWVTWQPDTTGVQPVIDAGGASYAVYLYGYGARLRWKGFKIQNFGTAGFYLYGTATTTRPDTLVVQGNTINGPYGIYLYANYGASDDSIIGNKINATSSYGIYAYGSSSYYSYRDIFANNMITGFTSYGIYMYYYWYYPKLLDNTIISPTASYALYQYYVYNDTMIGNILYGSAYAWYRYYGTTYPDYSDYNCFWMTYGSPTSYVISDQGTTYYLSTWQTTSGKDAHSKEWDPQTGAPINPHLKSNSPCIDSGVAIPGITTDIDGDARPYNGICDIGADEYTGVGSPMSGVYTIKAAGGGDYLDVRSGLYDVAVRGFGGNIEFDVYNGTYVGMVDFTGLPNGNYRMIVKGYPGQTAIFNAAGSYGIKLYSNQRIHFENLTFTGYTSYGFYVTTYYANLHTNDSCAVKFCTFNGPASAIYWSYGNADDTFWGNKIYSTSSYGIYLYSYSGTYGLRNVIANNMIYGSMSYAIYPQYQSNLRMVYNSVYTTGSYALYDYYMYSSPGPHFVRNNILIGGTYGAYFQSGGINYPDSSNYNDIRTTTGGATPIYSSMYGAQALADWVTSTARDSQSIGSDPVFVSTTNLHLQGTSPCIDLGKPIPGFTTDFDGNARGLLTDAGCHEYQADVACRSVIAPTGMIPVASPVAPRAAFKDVSGGSTSWKGYFAVYEWGTRVWIDSTSRSTNPGDSVTVTFNNWTPAMSDSYTCKAYVAARADVNPANDTAYGRFFVGQIDCSVTGIDTPSGIVTLGSTIYPRMRVRNNGNFNANIQVIYTIDDGTDRAPGGTPMKVSALSARGSDGDVAVVNSGTVSPGTPKAHVDAEVYRSLKVLNVVPPGRDTFVRMSTGWYASPAGTYYGRCSLYVTNDQNHNNDTLDVNFVVQNTTHDVGVTKIVSPPSPLDSGTTVTPACSVFNYGGYSESYSVRMKIGSGYNQTATVSGHAANTRVLVTFPAWTALVRGSNAMSCSTQLGTDVNHPNDKQTGTVVVDVKDVGAVAVTSPTGRNDTSVAITPQARVHNYGFAPATFTAYFAFTGYTNNVTITGLTPGQDTLVNFATWAKPHPAGTYTPICSTHYVGDVYPTNNHVTGSFSIVYTVRDTGWSRKADLSAGGKAKNVKDGGSLTRLQPIADLDSGFVYALKGNGTCEFYKYNTTTNAWTKPDSIPAIGRAGKKKAVKKGASLSNIAGKVYATKGNGTQEFWCYDPNPTAGPHWVQKVDVPLGAKAIKEGSGMAGLKVRDTSFVYLLKGSSTQEFYRYNPLSNVWVSRASAPVGISGKPFKDGSSIVASTDASLIFACKANYNEFYVYNADSNTWKTATPVPLIGRSGKKTKVKSGAGLAYYNRNVYLIKGNNTLELWRYQVDSGAWTQTEDMPVGGGKKVKGGGSLVSSPTPSPCLFAFKGNNTLEFYKYAFKLDLATGDYRGSSNTLTGSITGATDLTLCACPNPFSNATTISYSLPKPGNISLKLYDVTGKLVTTLATGSRNAGTYNLLTAPGLAQGIYLLKLETDDTITTTKLIIE